MESEFFNFAKCLKKMKKSKNFPETLAHTLQEHYYIKINLPFFFLTVHVTWIQPWAIQLPLISIFST